MFGLLGFLAFREFLQVNILAYVKPEDLFNSRRFVVYVVTSAAVITAWLLFYFLIIKKERRIFPVLSAGLPSLVKIFVISSAIVAPALLKWILPLPKDFALESWTMVFLFYFAALVALNLSDAPDSLPQKIVTVSGYFLLSGAAYAIFARLNLVTGYPFPTYWSEGNRYFDYSALLGAFRYTLPAGEPLAVFSSWGMQLPWAVPFLIPNLTIGAFRLWNQLVWILPGLLLGYVLAKQFGKTAGPLKTLFFIFWVFLFLDQGPIYAPLLIAAFFTVIAVRINLIPVSMALVLAAAYYAHSARWTWGYGPGLWAGMLSLLQIQNPRFRDGQWKQLIRPVLLGVSGYVGAQLIPSITRVFTRGSQLKLIPNPTASTTRQPLLWDRLWPNATFRPGIVLGLVWAVLPVVIFLIYVLVKKDWKLNLLQILAKAIIAAAFLTVGIIASTKIGGGSNLHNLDSFLVTLVLIAGAALATLLTRDVNLPSKNIALSLIVACVLITPVTYTLQNGERLVLPPQEKTNESLAAVRNKVSEFSTQGEILFIDHRQLLTFGLVENVPLIDDYEKKRLMDKAMASDAKYFSAFYDDISKQEFALIVNEPSNIIDRGSDYSFGEENDAYVRWVTAPLLCFYEPIYTSQATGLELLVPRTAEPPDTIQCDQLFPEFYAQ